METWKVKSFNYYCSRQYDGTEITTCNITFFNRNNEEFKINVPSTKANDIMKILVSEIKEVRNSFINDFIKSIDENSNRF